MRIIKEECAICEMCIGVCPLGIIKKKAYSIIVDKGCDNCGDCLDSCPVGAIVEDE
ncbi:MAG: 4Fe-4S dicluster domain-containing protein [Methanobacteriaceae archaeon]